MDFHNHCSYPCNTESACENWRTVQECLLLVFVRSVASLNSCKNSSVNAEGLKRVCFLLLFSNLFMTDYMKGNIKVKYIKINSCVFSPKRCLQLRERYYLNFERDSLILGIGKFWTYFLNVLKHWWFSVTDESRVWLQLVSIQTRPYCLLRVEPKSNCLISCALVSPSLKNQ